jgi:hypothetical protein
MKAETACVAAIDFGTSNSAVCLAAEGRTFLVPLEHGRETIPTAVFYNAEQQATVFGRQALQQYEEGVEGRLMRSLIRKAFNTVGLDVARYPRPQAPSISEQVFLGLLGLRDRPADMAAAFAAFCLRHYERSNAQLFQDLLVLFLLSEKRGGYFVEFGATNGISLSNTKLLEQDYGWRGQPLQGAASAAAPRASSMILRMVRAQRPHCALQPRQRYTCPGVRTAAAGSSSAALIWQSLRTLQEQTITGETPVWKQSKLRRLLAFFLFEGCRGSQSAPPGEVARAASHPCRRSRSPSAKICGSGGSP